MSKILVSGLCPLPWENTNKSYGPGIRTWQFAWSLARAGHDVRIEAMRIEDAYGSDRPVDRERRDGVEILRHDAASFLEGDAVRLAVDEWRPDAVVGATIYGSFALARHRPSMPFWADQFGHVMAEAQAKAARDGCNRVLPYFWRMVPPVMCWADRISVVSTRQKFAAVGELGCMGRLGFETCGYEFVSVIPCAQLEQMPGHTHDTAPPLDLPENAFVVLWSGSFNVWSDVRTLFEGLRSAMEQDHRIHFVSTGGAIPGHDERTYAAFNELVDQSPLRERFHRCGWVPAEEVRRYWSVADVGVLTELVMYEGELGSKNRIVQWLACGLPVIYNRVGDLGEVLESRELGLVFEPGRADEFSERVLWAASHRQELREMAGRAREYVLNELTFSKSTRELVAWANRPGFAPDRDLRGRVSSPADFLLQAETRGGRCSSFARIPPIRVALDGLRRLAKRVYMRSG